MSSEINKVLEFWFGDKNDEKQLIKLQSKLWWGKNVDFDNTIINEFSSLHKSAVDNKLGDWLLNAKGQLALIILFDQFSRVIHRHTKLAFSFDSNALNIALDGVSKSIDKSLRPIERVFYYMPLEHSEDLEIQNHCVALFQQLLYEVPEELKKEFENYLNFARKHQAIIERFNRFPHRNKVLNRFSSAEEIAFLAEPGSSF
ncbi:MAG: DUF924 domain-containing protein [Proteobacteria bacterium]|nr:DUF924 domain-containing protein [Pseudomonadota bacterium]